MGLSEIILNILRFFWTSVGQVASPKIIFDFSKERDRFAFFVCLFVCLIAKSKLMLRFVRGGESRIGGKVFQ